MSVSNEAFQVALDAKNAEIITLRERVKIRDEQIESLNKFLRAKDSAMSTVFELLDRADVDYSHLIP